MAKKKIKHKKLTAWEQGVSWGYKQGILDYIGYSLPYNLSKSASIRLKKFGRIKVKKSRIWEK